MSGVYNYVIKFLRFKRRLTAARNRLSLVMSGHIGGPFLGKIC